MGNFFVHIYRLIYCFNFSPNKFAKYINQYNSKLSKTAESVWDVAKVKANTLSMALITSLINKGHFGLSVF